MRAREIIRNRLLRAPISFRSLQRLNVREQVVHLIRRQPEKLVTMAGEAVFQLDLVFAAIERAIPPGGIDQANRKIVLIYDMPLHLLA